MENPSLPLGFHLLQEDMGGPIPEGEWSSFSGMHFNEEADFMAQLLGNCSLPSDVPGASSFGASSNFWPGHESTINMAGIGDGVHSSDNCKLEMHCFSRGISYSDGSSILFPTSGHGSYYCNDINKILTMNNSSMSANDCTRECKITGSPTNLMEEDDFLNQDIGSGTMEELGGQLSEPVFLGKNLQLKTESEMPLQGPSREDKFNIPLENPKKRSHNTEDVQKKKRVVKSKKHHQLVSTGKNDEENNAASHRHSSSSSWSEDDSNGSQESNGGATSTSSMKNAVVVPNLNGKTRGNRGSATDPQSLYARKRRERINERLKTLQNLVPNGTKVDISTMLEEAVQYVKFLQLQIKLLSSDDLWMYAPIAYNGMDIGLDLKITTPR
ncbi:hypothetical protein RJ639_009437 [Escallonia herrerae]|uniref:BHLH domain-containing protein n=1 Tax=Escallonia herrerae TaxID=1293975 RepID=A0AA88VUX8_9ASTE|nr:hypothetical protein RJ639_009437 [Escallonia herrerae]